MDVQGQHAVTLPLDQRATAGRADEERETVHHQVTSNAT
jgi:hypothetical protein